MLITSKDNETIKHIRKLKEKKYRDEYGEYVIEGIKLINEAIKEKANVKTIIVCDNCNKEAITQNSMYEVAKQNCIYVDEKVFNTITEVKNPQGILAVVGKPEGNKEINYKEDMIVILDDLQDPGNLGTILRTVDSVGLSQIIVSKKMCIRDRYVAIKHNTKEALKPPFITFIIEISIPLKSLIKFFIICNPPKIMLT